MAVNEKRAAADIYDDYRSTTQKLSSVRADKENLEKELKELSGQLNITDVQIKALNGKIGAVAATLGEIEKNLNDRRLKIADYEKQRELIIRDFYKYGQASPLELFIGGSLESLPRKLAYFKSVQTAVHSSIANLNEEINSFEANKKEAQVLRAQLAASSVQLTTLVNKLKNQAEEAQTRLSRFAAEEAILGQRLGELSSEISSQMSWQQSAALSVKESGAGRPNTPNPDGAPSWRITGYGTEHGVGMSQWGAFMKASQGWDEEKILRFYYQDIDFKTIDKESIGVDGYGQMQFEDEYLAGIGETDPVWRKINPAAAEVMDRVQIIAARTYAINKSSICTTQACQVYIGGTAKKAAVEATRGKVMVYKGSPISAFYFSTSGPSTSDIGNAPSFAFDNKNRRYKDSDALNNEYPYLRKVEFNDSDSPFNNWSAIIPNDWRSQAFPPKSDFSGGTPVGQIDMEDILNTALLSSSNLERVDSKTSMEDIKKMLKAEGKTPIEGLKSLGAVKMSGDNSRVKWVTAEGESGNISEGAITGIRFRYAFNVRSPEKDWIYSTWFEIR